MRATPSTTGSSWSRPSGRSRIEQRALFVLHHHMGVPLVEIAESLGIPAGTARSRLHYATQAMRKAIEAADAVGVARERTA